MKKFRKILFSTPALFFYICVVVWAAQTAILSTDTLNEAWTKETNNNSDLQTNIDGKQTILSEGAFVDGDKTNVDANTALAGVSDCTEGPCFDGTANSGKELYLMNPANTFYTLFQGGATLANRLIRPPIGAPAAGNLIQTDVNGNWSYIDTITIGFERYITSEGLVPAGGFEHRFDFGTLAANRDFVVVNLASDAIEFVIDGGGSAITTGVKGYLEIPWDCTINSSTLLADQSGSIVIDVWVDTYANYPPLDADSITASAPPTITTAVKSQDTTLTGWTLSLSKGDVIGFNVDSITTCERVTLSLKVDK